MPGLGDLIAISLISLGLIPKAILEAMYFQDRKEAKRTLLRWFLLTIVLVVALGFSLLIDYF